MTRQEKLEQLKEKALEILEQEKGNMTEEQFKEYVFNWLGYEKLCNDFYDSWKDYEHTKEELELFIKTYK